MRPVQLADIECAARVLLASPAAAREDLMRRLLEQAHAAEHCRRETGLMHPEWGNGTLMSAALLCIAAPRPTHCTSDYLRCLKIVVGCLLSSSEDQDP